MRVVFWGTPAFAVATLEALMVSHHAVAGVVTRPARPRGRGRTPAPTAVGKRADAAGLPVLAPERPDGGEFLAALAALEPDVSVVAAYGAILPPEALDLPARGSLNVHASLLPAYRGAAPVTRALLDGLSITGATIMRMDAGLDTGPIALQEAIPVGPAETAGTLTRRLAALGGRLAVEALDRLEAGELEERPQDDAEASYAPKVSPEQAELDWGRPAEELERTARAFDPWPGAWTTWDGDRVKVFRLGMGESDDRASLPPGTVLELAPKPLVRSGRGAVTLETVQPAGGRRMSGAAWARGRDLAVGDRLGE